MEAFLLHKLNMLSYIASHFLLTKDTYNHHRFMFGETGSRQAKGGGSCSPALWF
jgi:hypothetical protein